MGKSKRPTHCARCGKKLKRYEIPRAVDGRGPDTWCWDCCAQADENGESGGLSTYAVAALGYSSPYVPPPDEDDSDTD